MSEWVKTSRGWLSVKELDATELPAALTQRVSSRPQAVSNVRGVSIGRNVKANGKKGQRSLSVCVSEFIDYMDLIGAVRDIRRQHYLYDLMTLLMTKGISKYSGSARRQLFKILEAMVSEAMESELNVDAVKELLVCTMESMEEGRLNSIGSTALWNRHIHTVANLITKIEQFVASERVEDGLPTLTDLPKEVLRGIMLKLSDHKDIVNLGQTCTDLYYTTQDSSIWRRLVQYNFTEKQMNTFIEDTESSDSNISDLQQFQHSNISDLQQLQHKCSKKFGLKNPYADQLVICSTCKTLHWQMQGHMCWSTGNNNVYLEPVCTNEAFSLLF